eukprot:3807-Heterococcus_DN1.PRE.1
MAVTYRVHSAIVPLYVNRPRLCNPLLNADYCCHCIGRLFAYLQRHNTAHTWAQHHAMYQSECTQSLSSVYI